MTMSAETDTALSETSRPLRGRKLLLVEDDPWIAMELDDLIQTLGGKVLGPFSHVTQAVGCITREAVDGAVLDVRLNGEMTFTITDILMERGRAVLLVTGVAPESLPAKYRTLPTVRKPFELKEFERVAVMVFGAA
jgi:DNA-binding response OmpR family regulator